MRYEFSRYEFLNTITLKMEQYIPYPLTCDLFSRNLEIYLHAKGKQANLIVHHGSLHPLWYIGWGDTYFDINAFKAHSKQKDIKQGDTLFISMLL